MPTLQFIYFSSEWSRTQATIRFVVVFVYAPIQRLTIRTEYRAKKGRWKENKQQKRQITKRAHTHRVETDARNLLKTATV